MKGTPFLQIDHILLILSPLDHGIESNDKPFWINQCVSKLHFKVITKHFFNVPENVTYSRNFIWKYKCIICPMSSLHLAPRNDHVYPLAAGKIILAIHSRKDADKYKKWNVPCMLRPNIFQKWFFITVAGTDRIFLHNGNETYQDYVN